MKNISELTLIELKAIAYELIVQAQDTQNKLVIIQQEIQKKEAQQNGTNETNNATNG